MWKDDKNTVTVDCCPYDITCHRSSRYAIILYVSYLSLSIAGYYTVFHQYNTHIAIAIRGVGKYLRSGCMTYITTITTIYMTTRLQAYMTTSGS